MTVIDDPKLEAEFEAVLTDGEARTLGDIAVAADVDTGSWDRMYYFRAPMLMSELNRMLRIDGVTWKNLPTRDAEGLMVFVSEGQVVRAVVDRKPPLDLVGFATSASTVSPEASAGISRVAVESMGR